MNSRFGTKLSTAPVSTKPENPDPVPAPNGDSLIGTLLSVFGVGTFILVSWLAVFLLYLARG